MLSQPSNEDIVQPHNKAVSHHQREARPCNEVEHDNTRTNTSKIDRSNCV